MSCIEWTKAFQTGINEIDTHHQQLFQILNTLYDNRDGSATQRREVVGVSLIQLRDYARYHFAAEERLMREFQFPGYEEHQREHEKFTIRVGEFLVEYRHAGKTLSTETFEFLNDWIITHIQGTDKKYVPYLAGRGVH